MILTKNQKYLLLNLLKQEIESDKIWYKNEKDNYLKQGDNGFKQMIIERKTEMNKILMELKR